MQPGTILMMLVILPLLWGGFVGLLVYAMRVERRRRAPRDGTDANSGG